MPQNYYAADFDPWVHNIRSIGTMLAQMPALREQAQMRQMQGRQYQAQADQAESTVRMNDAKTADLVRKGQLVDRLQSISGTAETAIRSGNYEAPEVKEFTGIAAGLMGMSGKDAQDSLRSGIQTIEAMRGHARTAGLLQNPASVANNEATNERITDTPMVIPQGGIAIDKTTGQPIATGAQKLSIGQRLFMPRTDDMATISSTPAAEGAPTPPKTSMLDAIRARTLSQALVDDAKNGTTNAPIVMKNFDSAMGTGGPAPGAQPASIPQGAIDYLKANPNLRNQFDQKYGTGSASKILGQ